ncbi:tRNA-uridine aminocarboxypropyltransferase 1-like [Acipenser ruthenus]|uniref:tRNA-uridine aminocarboxypropyltransferase 1-like n=1 Tax=Acipenser ruthenus TaxID=7906 RepID=UPI001560641E|nr:tRNA-uridine aminocarboxypropyltransferase 1-like [Acipenser ruthenus]XP_034757826.1 tRNA-uridine aminocarboxypropyltransferase 1-like [Acipenser ruthenus]XP_058851097.1 tRNA-uridine aminocarboxypropyltransferase 1-like [Acipenser ruthenus]
MSSTPMASLTESNTLDFPDNQTKTSASLSDSTSKVNEPLQNLHLASHEVLERAQTAGRSKCSKCSGSRMFYCYTCCSLVGVGQEEIPKVKLPLKIDIIKHPNETDGKSTAVHAKLISPDDVSIYTYPCIPEYEDKRHEVVLVFPGPDSVTVEDLTNRLLRLADRDSPCLQDHHRSAEEPAPKRMKQDTTAEDGEVPSPKKEAEQGRHNHLLKRVVFIDSTWNQTNKIVTDERLQALLQVELKTRKTCFWRHQKGSPETYLSTIEAIYYFLIDFHQQCLSEEYHGEYDNLLFFYSYMYKLINKAKHAAGKL